MLCHCAASALHQHGSQPCPTCAVLGSFTRSCMATRFGAQTAAWSCSECRRRDSCSWWPICASTGPEGPSCGGWRCTARTTMLQHEGTGGGATQAGGRAQHGGG